MSYPVKTYMVGYFDTKLGRLYLKNIAGHIYLSNSPCNCEKAIETPMQKHNGYYYFQIDESRMYISMTDGILTLHDTETVSITPITAAMVSQDDARKNESLIYGITLLMLAILMMMVFVYLYISMPSIGSPWSWGVIALIILLILAAAIYFLVSGS